MATGRDAATNCHERMPYPACADCVDLPGVSRAVSRSKEMLWTTLDQDGNLTIQANEPIEAYALRQWEKQRAAGKAALKIETGKLFRLDQVLASLAVDAVTFKKALRDRADSTLVSDADAVLLEIGVKV